MESKEQGRWQTVGGPVTTTMGGPMTSAIWGPNMSSDYVSIRLYTDFFILLCLVLKYFWYFCIVSMIFSRLFSNSTILLTIEAPAKAPWEFLNFLDTPKNLLGPLKLFGGPLSWGAP